MNTTVTFKCADQTLCMTTMPVPPRIGEQIEHVKAGKAYVVQNVVWHILTANDNFPSHEATVYVNPGWLCGRKRLNCPAAPAVAVQRGVGLQTCMVMDADELCRNEAKWYVLSRKHCFKLMVCEQHGRAFLGISGLDVELQPNGALCDGGTQSAELKP